MVNLDSWMRVYHTIISIFILVINIYFTPPIEIIETKEGIPSELKLKYNHIGDFDVDSVNGILYGGNPNPIINIKLAMFTYL